MTLLFQVYAVIFNHIRHVIKAYSLVLRYYSDIARLIPAYSPPCVTLAYSQPYYILSPGIFWAKGLYKTLENVGQVYSELP